MPGWSFSDIPDLGGRTAVVTGGNAGLGFRSSLELARKGARVLLACRSPGGHKAVGRIRAELPAARVDAVALDLTDSASIERCAEEIASHTERLDILLNNAAVVNPETLQRTAAGHEIHMATNHFGHFALTGHLFPMLVATPRARVVTITSAAWRSGAIDISDLDWRRRPYSPRAYGTSKLANLLFMRVLQTRFEAAGASASSLAAHPGLAATGRQSVGMGGVFTRLAASPVHRGVRPQLRAATDPTAVPRAVYGPYFVIWGPACRVSVGGKAVDDALARRLWLATEEVTGVKYPAPPSPD